MSDNNVDVRTKVCAETHALLTAVSQATGKDIAEILRELVHDYLEVQVRKAKLIVANLPREGTSGSKRE